MVKSLFILVNFIGLVFLSLLLQKIEVQHNTPDQLSPGSSTEVEIIISKGKVEGFAKLQLNVDPGLTIEAIENAGASFTFNDQKAKFIWMSLPGDKDVVLRYRLIAAPEATGIKNIDGHFSYIDDNQRLVHDLSPAMVRTSEGDELASEDDSFSNETANVSVYRTVKPTEDGKMLVTLNLNKSNLGGFAKLQESISTDYTAVAVEPGDAVFNIVENKVKFVWFDIPAKSEMAVSYEIIPVVDQPQPNPSFSGEFSFLVNNETQTILVTSEKTDEAIAEAEDEPEPKVVEDTTDQTEITEAVTDDSESEDVVIAEESTDWDTEALTEEEKEQQRKEEEARLAEMNESEETEEVEEIEPKTEKEEAVSNLPETAISYRVQITAANKLVDEKYFASVHQYTGPFIVENHEGWIKYTTGGFDVYRVARDHRNQLNRQYNFPGPFVTAYNEGDRITVQEALMITNQKWVP